MIFLKSSVNVTRLQNQDQIFASLVQIRETNVSIAMQLPSSVHRIVTNSAGTLVYRTHQRVTRVNDKGRCKQQPHRTKSAEKVQECTFIEVLKDPQTRNSAE